MPTAIVHITCPKCGGGVDGIDSTVAPQTMPCPYCATELHVPHVGERIIHDVIHERVIHERVVATPERPSSASTLAAFAFAAILIVIYIAVRVAKTESSSSLSTEVQNERAVSKQCENECTSKCPTGEWTARDGNLYQSDPSAAFTRCTTRCMLSCSDYGIKPEALDPPTP